MTDPNAELRDLVARWGADPNLPPTDPEGIEDSPRSHVRALAPDSGGVKGGERRQERPLTPAMADATQPCETTPLAVTDLVYWTTTRQHGIGQVVYTGPAGFVDIRPFLPTRSHSVTVPEDRVRRICSLADLVAYIEFGAFP